MIFFNLITLPFETADKIVLFPDVPVYPAIILCPLPFIVIDLPETSIGAVIVIFCDK